jgi:hypothetical protein
MYRVKLRPATGHPGHNGSPHGMVSPARHGRRQLSANLLLRGKQVLPRPQTPTHCRGRTPSGRSAWPRNATTPPCPYRLTPTAARPRSTRHPTGSRRSPRHRHVDFCYASPATTFQSPLSCLRQLQFFSAAQKLAPAARPATKLSTKLHNKFAFSCENLKATSAVTPTTS